MSLPLTIVIHAVFIVSLIVAHELGHFIAGRLAGVPRNQMRIAVFSLPPHVAFVDGEEWVGPRHAESYGVILRDRFQSVRALFWFVAAGLTGQTLYAVIMFITLNATPFATLAWMGLSYSGAMLVFYLGFDPLMTWITGHPTGDVTAMFSTSPLRAALALLAMIAVHVFLLFLF